MSVVGVSARGLAFLALLFGVCLCGKPYSTVVINWSPYSVCDEENPSDSSANYGIGFNAAQIVYENMGWVEGTDYTYFCTTFFNGVVKILTDPQTLLFFVADVTYGVLKIGAVYSQVSSLIILGVK
jgi:hypothetical protein